MTDSTVLIVSNLGKAWGIIDLLADLERARMSGSAAPLRKAREAIEEAVNEIADLGDVPKGTLLDPHALHRLATRLDRDRRVTERRYCA